MDEETQEDVMEEHIVENEMAKGSGPAEEPTRRWRRATLLVAGGVTIAVLAVVIVGAFDDAPHEGAASLPMASDDSAANVLDRTITVVGQGTASAPPDAAIVRLGVETTAVAANDALDAANRSAQVILDVVTGAGVAESDVQTTDVSVYPTYDNDGRTITGYVATNRVVVTVRDLDGLGALLDAATGVVGDDIRIDGLTFTLDDPAAADAAARSDAIDDARARAEGYANSADVELGEVLSISETGAIVSPLPAYDGAMASGEGADQVPIAQGEQTRYASVTVVYAIG